MSYHYIAFHPSIPIYGTGDTPEKAFRALRENSEGSHEELTEEMFPDITFHTFDPMPEKLRVVTEPTIVEY